jgi:hypothetical protein
MTTVALLCQTACATTKMAGNSFQQLGGGEDGFVLQNVSNSSPPFNSTLGVGVGCSFRRKKKKKEKKL